jgi:hypothetical protein
LEQWECWKAEWLLEEWTGECPAPCQNGNRRLEERLSLGQYHRRDPNIGGSPANEMYRQTTDATNCRRSHRSCGCKHWTMPAPVRGPVIRPQEWRSATTANRARTCVNRGSGPPLCPSECQPALGVQCLPAPPPLYRYRGQDLCVRRSIAVCVGDGYCPRGAASALRLGTLH